MYHPYALQGPSPKEPDATFFRVKSHVNPYLKAHFAVFDG